MTTLTVTKARREFFDLVKGAADDHGIFWIQHRRGAPVLISEDDYEGLLEPLELLSRPRFRQRRRASTKQMKAGETVSMNKLFGDRK